MSEQPDWSEVTSAWERVLGDLGTIGTELTDSFREAWQESEDAATAAGEPGDRTGGPAEGPDTDPDATSPDELRSEELRSHGPESDEQAEAREPSEPAATGDDSADPLRDITETVDRSFQAVRSTVDRVGSRMGESGAGRDLTRSFEGALKLTLAMIAQLLLRLSDRLNEPPGDEAEESDGAEDQAVPPST